MSPFAAPRPPSADDLRHGLAIAFQPAVLHDEDMLTRVIAEVARNFVDDGVTDRRITNALAAVSIPGPVVVRLLQAIATERATPECETCASRHHDARVDPSDPDDCDPGCDWDNFVPRNPAEWHAR